MSGAPEALKRIRSIVAGGGDRAERAKPLAETVRSLGDYRWTGVYDVGSEPVSQYPSLLSVVLRAELTPAAAGPEHRHIQHSLLRRGSRAQPSGKKQPSLWATSEPIHVI